MAHGKGGWEFFDLPDYDHGDWTDEEFAAAYNNRDPYLLAGAAGVDLRGDLIKCRTKMLSGNAGFPAVRLTGANGSFRQERSSPEGG